MDSGYKSSAYEDADTTSLNVVWDIAITCTHTIASYPAVLLLISIYEALKWYEQYVERAMSYLIDQ